MVNPKNILLNEQLEGIQILIVELVRQVIIEISRKNTFVILVERSLENALICADYLSVIDRGTVVDHGKADEETACRFERHPTV
ncbi:urea transport system ATP-binding protein [Bacillus subtilis J22]|nr:urea transport system ATP-binding protein [Bacillus subtilis J22]